MYFKRGQLAMFVMVAILMVIILIVGFVVVKLAGDNNSKDSPSSNKYNNIRYCIEDVLEEGIYYNSLQGGYYFSPKKSGTYSLVRIPVYFEANRTYLPSIDSLEKELEDFVEDNADVCFNGTGRFDSFSVEILPGSVSYELKAPVVITEGNVRYNIERFEGNVNFDIYEAHGIIEEYLQKQTLDPEYFLISTLNSIIVGSGFFYEVLEVDENTKIVSIVFDNLNERGPVVYNFVLDYET